MSDNPIDINNILTAERFRDEQAAHIKTNELLSKFRERALSAEEKLEKVKELISEIHNSPLFPLMSVMDREKASELRKLFGLEES